MGQSFGRLVSHPDLSNRVIGLAIEVHRNVGLGLLEPALLPTHDAQILTFLHMSRIPVGLLLNFHAPRLQDGLRRLVV